MRERMLRSRQPVDLRHEQPAPGISGAVSLAIFVAARMFTHAGTRRPPPRAPPVNGALAAPAPRARAAPLSGFAH